MLKKLSLMTVLFAATLFLVACGGNPESEIIGTWDNGSGRIFLFVFDEAEEVEFRDNGRVVITQGDGASRTVDWELGDDEGTFVADGQNFTYTVRGDVLTITDSWNDSWTFDRQ
ncbi:MAG: hypothetical protein FWE07_03125 [Turicibacter sp.]|nr:hypothetical protein [Turicibacter sp.]